jgi:hypothetical protein
MDKYYIEKEKRDLKSWLLKQTDNETIYLYFITELMDYILNFIDNNNLKLNQNEPEVLMHLTKFLYSYSR